MSNIVTENAPIADESMWSGAKQKIIELWPVIKWFALILAIVVSAALFAHWNAQRAAHLSTKELQGIKRLLSFVTISAEQAQKTRAEPLQSLLHANYAICFLNAAKNMIDGGQMTLQQLAPEIDIATLHSSLKEMQLQLLQRIRQRCFESAQAKDITAGESATSN